jgi:hypothetical protein
MPQTAEIVDEMRSILGRDLVDQAIRNGMALQRKYEAMKQSVGIAAADSWLQRQSPDGPTFSATETTQADNLTVGLLGGCPSVAQQRGVR